MNRSIFLIIIIMAALWLILDSITGPRYVIDRWVAVLVPETAGR